MKDPRTVGLVQIFKGMKASTDGQIGRILKKGKAWIHEPPIWLKFLKGEEGENIKLPFLIQSYRFSLGQSYR